METHMRRLAGAATLAGVVVVVLVAHTGVRGVGQEPAQGANERQVTQADVGQEPAQGANERQVTQADGPSSGGSGN